MWNLSGLCLLLAALNIAVAEDKVITAYFTDGGVLTFDVTRSPPAPITNILWKFKGDLLAEWVQDKVPLDIYPPFTKRADLDKVSARLVVRDVSKADRGTYTLAINSKVHGESYEAVWIRKLDETNVVIRPLTCAVGMESCNASCVTNTADAVPVAYSWKIGENEWKGSEKDTIEITTSDNVLDKTITCQISNPVSKRVSKDIDNPLYHYNPVPTVVGVLVPLLFVCVAGCVLFMWKYKKGPFKAPNSDKLGPSPNTSGPTAIKLESTAVKPSPTTRVPHGDRSSTISDEVKPLTKDRQDNEEK